MPGKGRSNFTGNLLVSLGVKDRGRTRLSANGNSYAQSPAQVLLSHFSLTVIPVVLKIYSQKFYANRNFSIDCRL